MDKQAVFHKTEKGQQEIASRAFRLPARERSVLIMVDGKSTAQEIIDKAKHFGDAERFLSDLLKGGFIEEVTAAQTVQAQSPAAPDAIRTNGPGAIPAGTPTVAVSVSLASAMQFASRFMLDAIGPDGEIMVMKIEACTSREQFMPLVEKYRDVLRAMRGKHIADQFWQGVTARLP